MLSSTKDRLLEIIFLAVISVIVVFLLCVVVCKIRQCIWGAAITKTLFSRNTSEEQSCPADAIQFVEEIPRSTRILTSDQRNLSERNSYGMGDKALDRTVDKSDIIKDVFSLEVDQTKTKKRKFHQTTPS